MRDAYFTGIWKRAAAKQTDVADSVMRIAKRSLGNERLFGIEQTSDAVEWETFASVVAALTALAAGIWYGRRRWLR